MKIRQHIPGFVTGVEPDEADVETLAELLALPWVKQYETRVFKASFHRWSAAFNSGADYHLMAEYNGGTAWWVVAYMEGGDPGLPKWQAMERKT